MKSIKFLPIIIAVLIILLGLVLFIAKKMDRTTADNSSYPAVQSNSPLAQTPKANVPEEDTANQSRAVVAIDDSSRNIALPGKNMDDSELFVKYGKYAFEAFQKNPALIDKIKAVDNTFKPSQMDTSFPSHVYQLDNGKVYLALGGCTVHDCAGTKIAVIYNENDNTVFMARENSSETQLSIIGDPPAQEKSLLIYFYFLK